MLPLTCPPTANTEILDENLIELDSSILEILGEDPTAATTYGKDIQKDLAVRLEHIATQGLSRETRKELLEKFLIPSNCTLIDAPAINPEIKGAIPIVVAKRTKAMEYKQKQLAGAIAGLSIIITQLINKKDSNSEILKNLMDVCRLLCDCQHNDSVTRKGFILSTLKKDMKEQIENTKIDKFLFGNDLAETLKAAKAINKSSAELKPVPVKQPTRKAANFSSKNVKAPPTRRGTTSTSQRPQETAPERRTKLQRASSSRTSQRASRHNHR
ncbi:uncharacterized protein LOC132904432 [Amyelois transitella]|uniref:uncharacterized protein LOC132904432 n=1 Tax=Amyelois transitella TaxID=680683 RepID=UPI0029902F94|nr:uncharacterized protein LOC132904432 [Amyelois transitella]